MGCLLNMRVCNVAVIIAKVCNILGLGGHDIQCKHYHTGRLYSLFRHATNYDCYTYVYSWVWAYSRALALTGGQAQYVDFVQFVQKIRLFKVIHYLLWYASTIEKKANLFVKLRFGIRILWRNHISWQYLEQIKHNWECELGQKSEHGGFKQPKSN